MSRPPTVILDARLQRTKDAADLRRQLEAWSAEGRIASIDVEHAASSEPRKAPPSSDELAALLFPASPSDEVHANAEHARDVATLREAIAGRVEFLLTEDENLHRCEEIIGERWEIHVMRPEDFVALFQLVE